MPKDTAAARKVSDTSLQALIRALFTAQVREIWLSSEDTGAYGRDIGSSVGELLNMLTRAVGEV